MKQKPRPHCHWLMHKLFPAWSHFHQPFAGHHPKYIRTCKRCGRKEHLLEHPLEWVRLE